MVERLGVIQSGVPSFPKNPIYSCIKVGSLYCFDHKFFFQAV